MCLDPSVLKLSGPRLSAKREALTLRYIRDSQVGQIPTRLPMYSDCGT